MTSLTLNTTYSNFNKQKLPLIRISGSVVLGAVITFGIFAVMHHLIKQDNQVRVEPKPPVFINSILDITETPTIKRTIIKPLPEIPEVPKTKMDIPQTPNVGENFSSIISIPTTTLSRMDFDVQAIDQQPRPIVRVDPRYPPQAANNGIEGYVSLRFGVSASGEVIDIELVDAQPGNTFTQAAKRALRKWRYQPKMVSGTPVAMSGLQVKLEFNLAGD